MRQLARASLFKVSAGNPTAFAVTVEEDGPDRRLREGSRDDLLGRQRRSRMVLAEREEATTGVTAERMAPIWIANDRRLLPSY